VAFGPFGDPDLVAIPPAFGLKRVSFTVEAGRVTAIDDGSGCAGRRTAP